MTVYFVQIGTDGPIKIGKSKNVESRIRSLQVGVPWKLRVLLVSDSVDDFEVYHQFSASRMNGEWFYPTRELLEFIETQHPIPRPNPKSWRRARRRAGTYLTTLRRVVDLCGHHVPSDLSAIGDAA